MKNTAKFGLFGAVLTLFVLSGCNEDSPKSQLSKANAKLAIDEFNASAVNDLQQFTDAAGTQAIGDMFGLVDLDDPFGRIGTDRNELKSFFKGKGKAFKSIFVPSKAINGRASAEEPFEFNAKKGIYTWNEELGEFEVTGESNIIRIQFPTEGSSSNNAELKLNAFSEVEVFDEELEEYTYLPTAISAELLVNTTKVASLEFEAVWDELGFPITVGIELKINDFTFTLSLDTSGNTSSTLTMSFTHSQETIMAASVTVRYGDNSKSEDSLEKIEGFVQFKELKLKGNINVAAADAEEVDWNDIYNFSLYKGNDKLGDVVFVMEMDEEGFEELVAYLKYADGSKEKLETVLTPVMDELEAIGAEFGLD